MFAKENKCVHIYILTTLSYLTYSELHYLSRCIRMTGFMCLWSFTVSKTCIFTLMLYSVEYKFVKHQNMECLYGHNIDWMISSQPEKDCTRRCINNNKCGGFTTLNITRYPNRCYFKNKSCEKNLYQNQLTTVFIPQGNQTN